MNFSQNLVELLLILGPVLDFFGQCVFFNVFLSSVIKHPKVDVVIHK